MRWVVGSPGERSGGAPPRRRARTGRSRQGTKLDVPEGDGELLVLEPQVPFRELRVMDIERGLAVQFDDEMIAVCRDPILIPPIGGERGLTCGLRDSNDGAGVVS